MLSNVIATLDLNRTWGLKYFNGQTLKSSETLEILRGRLGLAPVRNTELMTVTVFSDDKNEAAEIANAITKSYQDYRKRALAETKAVELERLQQEYKNEGEQLQKFQLELDGSRQDSNATASVLKAKEHEFSQMAELHKLLLAKIQTTKMDVILPATTMVQITDPAEPGKAPVKPNRTLNIVFGGFFSLLLAGVLGGVAFFISKSRQRNRAPEALAGN